MTAEKSLGLISFLQGIAQQRTCQKDLGIFCSNYK